MKIGIISDIHGNLPALEVIINKFNEEKCENIYCLGDVIGIGPYPKECLELLLSIENVKFIMGNHEECFVNGIPSCVSDGERDHQKWVANQLDDNLKGIVKDFPYIIEEEIEEFNVAFTHYAMNKEEKRFKPIEKNPTIEKLDELFKDIYADIIFFGHEHKQQDLRGRRHYINIGSSGCTKDNITYCTIMDVNNGKYNISRYYMEYDKEKIFKGLGDKKVPQRDFISKIFFGREDNLRRNVNDKNSNN
jgi:putative phosphoesterase